MATKRKVSIVLLSLLVILSLLLPLASPSLAEESKQAPSKLKAKITLQDIIKSIPLQHLTLNMLLYLGGEQTARANLEASLANLPLKGAASISANFSLTEKKLSAVIGASGRLLLLSSTNEPMPATINGNIKASLKLQGPIENVSGEAYLGFFMNLTSSGSSTSFNASLPFQISFQYSREENKTITIVKTNNGVIEQRLPSSPGGFGTPIGQQGSTTTVKVYSKTITDFNRMQVVQEAKIRLESDNQVSVISSYMMIVSILSIVGVGLGEGGYAMPPQPQKDPATGKWFIEQTINKTQPLSVIGYNKNIPIPEINYVDVDLSLQATSTTPQGVNGIEIILEGGGHIDISGDFSRGVSLDSIGATVLRNAKGSFRLVLGNGTASLQASMDSKYSSIDPFLAQYTINTFVPGLLGSKKATSDSLVVVVASAPYRLFLEDEEYSRLSFTPANATEASKVRIAYNGTMLETLANSTHLVFRLIERGKPAFASVSLESASKVTIHAEEGSKAVIKLGFKELKGKIFEAYLGDDGYVAVEFTSKTSLIGDSIKLEISDELPAQIPQGYAQVSSVYNIEVKAKSEGVNRVSLKYNGKLTSGGELLVAHYVNGSWELLEPVKLDASHSIIVVETTSFSPFVVVEKPAPAASTTTTATTTATTQTTTTTSTPTETITTITTTTTTPTTTSTTTTTTTQPSPTPSTTTTKPSTTTITKTSTTAPTSTATTTTKTTTSTSKPPTTTKTTKPPSTTQLPSSSTQTPQNQDNTITIVAIIAVIIIVAVIVLALRRK